ncbi:MAG TPA: hypothetical protein VMY37_18780 [Thermoguttaceae bacterium]|nr:hypothetical protein [Thermoguttaceae bacterium]
MNLMKRLGLVALVFLLVAIFGASPALAGKPAKSSATVPLAPPAVDPPEPIASGTVTYVHSWWYDQRAWVENVDVTVSCESLTPTNQYCVVFFLQHMLWNWDGATMDSYWYERLPATTNKKGQLKSQWSYLPETAWNWPWDGCTTYILDIWVENDLGNVVLERAP